MVIKLNRGRDFSYFAVSLQPNGFYNKTDKMTIRSHICNLYAPNSITTIKNHLF